MPSHVSSSDFLLFIQSETPTDGMVLPTFRVDLSSLVKPFWKQKPSQAHHGDSKSNLNLNED